MTVAGRAKTGPPILTTRAMAAAAAAVAAIAALVVAAHHPLAPFIVGALVVAWIAATHQWPLLALFALPALLPVIDLAPWTGWIAVEEFDLLVLGAIAGGYARVAICAPGEPTERSGESFALSGKFWIALFLLSQGVAVYRGLADAGGFAFGWTQGYEGPMNSLRIAKSLLFALAVIPLVGWLWRRWPASTQRALAAGLVAGLVAASLAVVWERIAFTDLLNFSTDYRTTALFWEMHVGGAALDGFLALTLPFAVWMLHGDRRPVVLVACWGAVALAAYAVLTTFSRGLYLAIAVSLVLLAWLMLRQQTNAERSGSVARFTINAIVAMVACIAAWFVFRAGGYRALAAMVAAAALTLATAPVARAMGRGLLIGALAAGVLAAMLAFGVGRIVPKGPYVVFAVLAAIASMAWLRVRRGDDAAAGVVAVAAYVAVVISAVAVALHWGGELAFRDAAAVGAALLVLWLVAAARDIPGWPRSRTELGQAGLAMAIASGVVAVFSGGAYMGDRFASAERDMSDRLQHWRTGLDLLESPADWAIGKGMGRFPSAYFFGESGRVVPGGYRVTGTGADAVLVLSSPSYSISFGDAFRVSQRVAAVPGTYAVHARVRTKHPALLHFEICEKHLLYSGECAIGTQNVEPGEDRWQQVVATLEGGRLSRGRWFAPRLAFFSIALETSGRAVELDDLSLIDPNGRELLGNGDFSDDMAHWFFTSDRFHLPWHAKNLLLNVLFEQGVLGLVAFLGLVARALGRLTFGWGRGHPLAPALGASVAGFLVVGAFDSLLDVPRVAFVFYLLLLVGLALRRNEANGRAASL